MAVDTTLFKQYLVQVRARLRDYPELNELLEDTESSDKLIAMFMIQALDWFNGTPPFLDRNYSWVDFPNRTLLIDMVLVPILESVAFLDARNSVPVNDGTAIASPHQKAPMIWNMAQSMRARILRDVKELKRSLSMVEMRGSQGDYDIGMQYLYGFVGWGEVK